jgi:hypothetical protein
VCVVAHDWNSAGDRRIRQTVTASPAEPGGLSLTLDRCTCRRTWETASRLAAPRAIQLSLQQGMTLSFAGRMACSENHPHFSLKYPYINSDCGARAIDAITDGV